KDAKKYSSEQVDIFKLFLYTKLLFPGIYHDYFLKTFSESFSIDMEDELYSYNILLKFEKYLLRFQNGLDKFIKLSIRFPLINIRDIYISLLTNDLIVSNNKSVAEH